MTSLFSQDGGWIQRMLWTCGWFFGVARPQCLHQAYSKRPWDLMELGSSDRNWHQGWGRNGGVGQLDGLCGDNGIQLCPWQDAEAYVGNAGSISKLKLPPNLTPKPSINLPATHRDCSFAWNYTLSQANWWVASSSLCLPVGFWQGSIFQGWLP